MKNRFILFFFLCISYSSMAQVAFVFTVNVNSWDREVKLIATEPYSYNYTIDWGDGNIQNNVTQTWLHTYAQTGVYTLVITGDFPHLNLEFDNDVQIINVVQWGVNSWRSMEDSFRYQRFLQIDAPDAPDLSQVTSLKGMFYGCISLNSPINHWDVSNITNMQETFNDSRSFNQPLDNWDVSNVTDMQSMFRQTELFNQPINSWDVSNVTNMQHMFNESAVFNQPLDSWNVSNVTNMAGMFDKANAFNGSVNSWNVSNVTSMGAMFSAAFAFNKPLNNWDVSNVTNLVNMFFGAISFNQNLNNWDISNITSLQNVFRDAREFNQPLNNWNVSNVTNMEAMFSGTDSFNQPLDNWDVSNVTNMEEMFKDAISFDGTINNWDVSNVEDVYRLFNGASTFNQPLNDWDVSNLIYMRDVFRDASSFNQPLNNWDVSNIINFGYMFSGASSFNQSLSDWDFSGNGGPTFYINYFLDNSNLDVIHYDSLLNNFITSGQTGESIGVSGLEYCNIEARDYLINNLGWNINGDSISPTCSNLIFGSVLYDLDGNGCVAVEIPNNLLVKATQGNYEFSTPVDANGDYSFYVYGDELDVTMSIVHDYLTVSPESQTVVFDGINNEEQVDFCIIASEAISDLNIRILPLGAARPGFEADYMVLVENVGTETIDNVSVTLTFNDTMQSFVSAMPSPSVTTSNTLDFELGTLLPFGIQEITFTMQTFPPPTVNGDDVLNFIAQVLPDVNDYTPDDNTFRLEQIVVNSFDPNDKRVLQGTTIGIDETNKYLDYIIRFQNTGTANAINVRVEDQLHPNLDWSTLSIVNVSHDYEILITDQNKLEFIFDNINLPYEADDEPASHGYITYKIKPKTDIQIGEFMTGNAAIFFDFNAPIITNTVSTEVIDLLSVTEFNLDHLISVFPNPADDNVFLKTNESVTIESIKLYNIHGSELLNIRENVNYIETKNLLSGMYLLNIETNKGTINKKLMIR